MFTLEGIYKRQVQLLLGGYLKMVLLKGDNFILNCCRLQLCHLHAVTWFLNCLNETFIKEQKISKKNK